MPAGIEMCLGARAHVPIYSGGLLESDILHSLRVTSFSSSENINNSAPQDMISLDITCTGQLCRAEKTWWSWTWIKHHKRNLLHALIQLPSSTRLALAGQRCTPLLQVVTVRSLLTVLTLLSSQLVPLLPRFPASSPTLPADPSFCLTYFSPLDTSKPHLVLNASLAPGCQTLNATYLPDPCWDDSMWCPSPPSPSESMAANTTMWDMASSPPPPGLFLSSRLQCERAFTSKEVSLSRTRSTTVLTSPYVITFFQPPDMEGFYIVTRPLHDWVGCVLPHWHDLPGKARKWSPPVPYKMVYWGIRHKINLKLQIFELIFRSQSNITYTIDR